MQRIMTIIKNRTEYGANSRITNEGVLVNTRFDCLEELKGLFGKQVSCLETAASKGSEVGDFLYKIVPK